MITRFRIFLMYGLLASIAWYGCDSEEAPPVDCTDDPVELEVVSVENSSCNLADGSIEVIAAGGAGSYQYSIEGGNAQAGSIFGNLGAGVYEITAADANNCSTTIEITVDNADGLNIAFEAAAAGCNDDNGSITITATNGTEPYQYKLDDGSFSDNHTFSNLMPGEYNLLVNDATGCAVNQTVKVLSGVSFSASISPIINNKCAINTCHNGTQFPDFRVFKNIQDNAAQIKTLTGNGTMPKEGSLTQEEKDLIACWVDDGALAN